MIANITWQIGTMGCTDVISRGAGTGQAGGAAPSGQSRPGARQRGAGDPEVPVTRRTQNVTYGTTWHRGSGRGGIPRPGAVGEQWRRRWRLGLVPACLPAREIAHRVSRSCSPPAQRITTAKVPAAPGPAVSRGGSPGPAGSPDSATAAA